MTRKTRETGIQEALVRLIAQRAGTYAAAELAEVTGYAREQIMPAVGFMIRKGTLHGLTKVQTGVWAYDPSARHVEPAVAATRVLSVIRVVNDDTVIALGHDDSVWRAVRLG